MSDKSSDFFARLNNYYSKVAEVLRGQADASAIFPNPTDREFHVRKYTQNF